MDNNKRSLYLLLNKYSDVQQIKAGNNIFSFGKPANRVYLILKGRVRLFIKDKNKEEKEIEQLMPGDILGEEALSEQAKYSFKATASKDTNLLSFSPENFTKIIHKENTIAEKVIKNLVNRIQILQKQEIKLPEDNNTLKMKIDDESKAKDKKIIKSIKKQDAPNFYLKGHGKYSEVAGENFSYYFYTKEIECPVCSSKIKIKKIRSSRLHLQEIRDDLRPVYKDFIPHWYEIWVCSQCFYTALYRDFFDLTRKKRKKVKGHFKDKIISFLGPGYKPGFSEPRTLNEVFDAYYIAIELYKLIDGRKDRFAHLWLRLSWLYEDINENELSDEASYRAMEYLRDFYFNNNYTELSNSQNDKLTLLLSILFYKHNLEKEAVPLLYDLIHSPDTKARYKNQARDIFMKIRKKKRNDK